MATVNQTLSCTGNAVPIVQKFPAKIQTATGTGSVSILKIPGRVLSRTAVSTPVIALLRFGIDTFDIVQVSTRWFIKPVDSVTARAQKRFGIMVRGRPNG